jgi:hypothetical protein
LVVGFRLNLLASKQSWIRGSRLEKLLMSEFGISSDNTP